MFSLHETVKTRLCRAAFLALCLGPTCAVLAWCAFIHTPHFRRSHERAITATLGWQARLQCASTPRPGLLLYEWLELADPKTGELVARLPFVEIHSGGKTLIVRLPHPATINCARLDTLVKLVEGMARQDADARPLRFEAQNLTLQFPSGDQSFTDVCGEVGGDGGDTHARLAFYPATSGQAALEPCLLAVGRDHDDPTQQSIQLTTGTSSLPTALLAPFWAGASELGKTCEFSGRIAATRQADSWTATLAGRLSNVDLDQLVSERFPHKLTGSADASFDALTLRDGRIEAAHGSITAGPGTISRSLVQSAETHLHIRAADRAIAGPGNVIGYRQLGLAFEIDPQGMVLHGAIPQASGALLTDDRHVLAAEPMLASQPVLALVRTLVPQSEMHVPATRETAGLTNTLPVPTVALRPGTEQPLPHARPLNVNPLRASETFVR